MRAVWFVTWQLVLLCGGSAGSWGASSATWLRMMMIKSLSVVIVLIYLVMVFLKVLFHIEIRAFSRMTLLSLHLVLLEVGVLRQLSMLKDSLLLIVGKLSKVLRILVISSSMLLFKRRILLIFICLLFFPANKCVFELRWIEVFYALLPRSCWALVFITFIIKHRVSDLRWTFWQHAWGIVMRILSIITFFKFNTWTVDCILNLSTHWSERIIRVEVVHALVHVPTTNFWMLTNHALSDYLKLLTIIG